jgi:hypothetical protein
VSAVVIKRCEATLKLGLLGRLQMHPVVIQVSQSCATNPSRSSGDSRLISSADHGPQLVIEELLPAVFDVFVNRIRSPIASMIFSR